MNIHPPLAVLRDRSFRQREICDMWKSAAQKLGNEVCRTASDVVAPDRVYLERASTGLEVPVVCNGAEVEWG